LTRPAAPSALALDVSFLAMVDDWRRGGPGCDDAGFDAHARALFVHQLERNEPYARYAESCGFTLARQPRTWREIPAVPSSAFKDATLATFDVARAELEFHTSGTTTDRVGKHFVERAELYDASLAAGFDRFIETQCAVDYAPRLGRPSLPPGRYFRMLLIGYFEGIDSERGLEWRCADSLSLRDFLRLGERERVPDHSWLSRTRSRLSLEVHDQVFSWVLKRLAEHGLIKGERIGVDASTIEANAALRTIIRRDSGEGYREMLTRMAQESGIETPTTEDLVRLDRKRKGKKLSNADWESPTDPDARIAKLKDGRTHLAYKPEHAMDLDTGAVVAAELHPADQGDTTTMPNSLPRNAPTTSSTQDMRQPKDIRL